MRLSRYPFLIILFAALGCQAQPSGNPNSTVTTSAGTAAENHDAIGTRGAAAPEKSRKFRFHYAGTIHGLEPGDHVRTWLPIATNGHEQTVEVVRTELPAAHRETVESKYGNHLYYFEATADAKGEVPIFVEYIVERRAAGPSAAEPIRREQLAMFLDANQRVPTDSAIRAKLLNERQSRGDVDEVARRVFRAVDDHMAYGKPQGEPWGQGDANWACKNGFGNCTDFHSLFISASRNLGIPARFEIGFSIPTERASGTVAGYHCWAKFAGDEGWTPVDVAEADQDPENRDNYFGHLTADRVTFTIGRDLQLEPPQDGGAVNFLVYPYVEVDGKPHERFIMKFRYENME